MLKTCLKNAKKNSPPKKKNNSGTLNQFPRSTIILRKLDTIVYPHTNRSPALPLVNFGSGVVLETLCVAFMFGNGKVATPETTHADMT